VTVSDLQAPNGNIVNPATGELLDGLEFQPPERLAELSYNIRDLQAKLKDFDALIDDELRRRLDARGRRQMVFGEWDVELQQGRNEAVWDADDLEAALRALVDDGTLNAGECTGLITHETVVHRTELNRLLGHLSGQARAAVEACRTWRRKGAGRVRVEKQVPLIPESKETS
jgi:hypothetical protein